MRVRAARSAVLASVAAAIVLALSTQGVTARGGASGVTTSVNSSFKPAHRMIQQRFGYHRSPSHSPRSFHTPSRHGSDTIVTGTFGGHAVPGPGHGAFGLSQHPGEALIIVSEEGKSGPIVPPFSGVVTRTVEAGGVVVFRGPAVRGIVTGTTPGGSAGGKLILISP